MSANNNHTKHCEDSIFLGVPPPFFPGILLSRKPPLKPRLKTDPFFCFSSERTMVEKNGKGITPLFVANRWGCKQQPYQGKTKGCEELILRIDESSPRSACLACLAFGLRREAALRHLDRAAAQGHAGAGGHRPAPSTWLVSQIRARGGFASSRMVLHSIGHWARI